MKEKYELIDDFPSSFTKYQVSLITEMLDGREVDACDIMYDKEDLRNEPKEDQIETLVFDKTEKIQMFLDAKNHIFRSRRVDPLKLTDFLKSEYDYDPARIMEFDDDKNALFLILFNKTYNAEDNTINLRKFSKARAASYKFKDKRDRMTEIDEQIDLMKIVKSVADFEDIVSNDIDKITTYEYYDEMNRDLVLLFQQEDKRSYDLRFKSRVDEICDYDVTYVEQRPVRENALYFDVQPDKTKIQSRSSVSSWEETFSRLFTIALDEDYTGKLQETESVKAKEIVENVKEQTDGDKGEAENSGSQILSVISNDVQDAFEEVEIEETNLNENTIKEKIKKMTVTGIEVNSDDAVFEIHYEDGISSLLNEYKGMSASLSQAVANAEKEDITIFAEVPTNTSEDNDEFVLEDGEWYMSSVSSESTMEALEAVF